MVLDFCVHLAFFLSLTHFITLDQQQTSYAWNIRQRWYVSKKLASLPLHRCWLFMAQAPPRKSVHSTHLLPTCRLLVLQLQWQWCECARCKTKRLFQSKEKKEKREKHKPSGTTQQTSTVNWLPSWTCVQSKTQHISRHRGSELIHLIWGTFFFFWMSLFPLPLHQRRATCSLGQPSIEYQFEGICPCILHTFSCGSERTRKCRHVYKIKSPEPVRSVFSG